MSALTRAARALWLLVTLLALGCGSATAPAPPPAAPPPPPPRNAHSIAAEIVQAKLTVAVHHERLRTHALGAKVLALRPWGDLLDGSGVDPLIDVERSFIAAANMRDEEHAVVVLEHRLDEARLGSALDALVRRSGERGGWIDAGGVRAARVVARGRERALAPVTKNVLVVLPLALAPAAARFAGTGGLPENAGPEAVMMLALEPAETLRGPRVPAVPPTLRLLAAAVRPAADGGADLAVDGASSGAEQAALDAAALNRNIDDATSITIGILRMRAFEPIVLHAEAERVRGDRHLSAAELDTIASLAAMALPH